MLFNELLALTDNQATYDQYKAIEAIYMAKESMTKAQAAKLWQKTYNQVEVTINQDYMRIIKDYIKDLKYNRQYAKADSKACEQRAKANFNEYIQNYNTGSFTDNYFVNQYTQRHKTETAKALNEIYESYGNDSTFHIIYNDGSEAIFSGIEVLDGLNPKMQNVAYITLMDGWQEIDTLTGELKYDVSIDAECEAREEYFNNIERKFKTAWGLKHHIANMAS